MPTWTLSGENGKQFNPVSAVTLASLDVKSANVTFRSLGVDTLVYEIEVEPGTSLSVEPELGQRVSLNRNGVQFFSGHCTDIADSDSASSSSVQVTISGPWWYAENVALTSNVTSPAGNTGERQTFQYGESNLRTSIQSTINRGIALGVPWQLGTVSNFFSFPLLTLNQNSVGGALAELVRLCPDAMAWFDYSSTPAILNVTRRGSATARTITIGSDDVVSFSVHPLKQLQVTGVRVPYASRATNGKRAFQEQSAGGAGNVQVLTVSGPELDTYLPPDPPSESVKLTTIATGSIGSAFNPMANTTNADIIGLIAKYGANWAGTSNGISSIQVGVGNGAQIRFYNQSSPGVNTGQTFTPARPTFLNDSQQPVTGHFLYPGINVPDWLAPTLGGTKVTWQYTYYIYHRWKSSESNTEPYFPGQADFFAGSAVGWQDKFTGESGFDRISIYYAVYGGEGIVLPGQYSGFLYYKPPEYSFVFPPSGFAANMLSAQNWLPYEGSIQAIYEDAGGTRFSGCKVNLAGARRTALATMDALVESESIDLMTGATAIGLGSPPRINFKSLLGKVRRTPQDNIISNG